MTRISGPVVICENDGIPSYIMEEDLNLAYVPTVLMWEGMKKGDKEGYSAGRVKVSVNA